MTDEANRATLDPPGCIDAVNLVASIVNHSPSLVLDDTVFGIERNLSQLAAEITNGAINGLNCELAILASGFHIAGAIEFGAFNFEASHLATLADDLDRRTTEVQVQAASSVGALVAASTFKSFDHHTGLIVRIDLRLRTLVVFKVFVINDRIDAFDFESLAQFKRSELNLSRAAATKNVHVGDRRFKQALINVVWNIRRQKLFRVLHQNASNV